MRTSTLVLIVAFLALWWVYSEYRPQEQSHSGPPSTQVVPPGFVPDPNYTWVPRSQVQGAAVHRDADAHADTDDHPPQRPRRRRCCPPIVLPPPFGPPHQRHDAAARSGSSPGASETAATAARLTVTPATSRVVAGRPDRVQRHSRLHWRPVMITLDHVTKQYKSSARPALDNVDLKIDKGEFVFLIGPSGSGKSTFMRLLLAAETPTKGDVRVSKFHVNTLPGRHIPKLRQVIGCVFQDFRLLQQKTVFENVAFALEVIGKRADVINRVVPDVLEMVGLSGKASRLPTELSGGEQQRVAIARAFVNRPLVLLADEPTGNLDPETSNDIMDLLERINRTGTTVLMATHDHHIVDSMRQRVVELSLGRLVRDEQRGIYGMDR